MIVAHCVCGSAYTRDEWDALPLDGEQHVGDGGPDHELRTCVCKATLTIEIECVHGPGPREDRTTVDLERELTRPTDPDEAARAGLSVVEWRQTLESALRARRRRDREANVG